VIISYICIDESVQNTQDYDCYDTCTSNTITGNDTDTNTGGNDCCDGMSMTQGYSSNPSMMCDNMCKLFLILMS